MVSKKDFKAVAEIIKEEVTCRPDIDPILAAAAKDIGRIYAIKLANYFATQNPRFDRDKFMKACGLGD